MIDCTPTHLFSWTTSLEGDGIDALLTFNWFGESGGIDVNGVSLSVKKLGLMSGEWSLLHDGNEVGSAKLLSIFKRTAEIHAANDHVVVRAESAFRRSFLIERDGRTIARIATNHAFTRKATIDTFTDEWDPVTLAFAIWIVSIFWRRQASAAAS